MTPFMQHAGMPGVAKFRPEPQCSESALAGLPRLITSLQSPQLGLSKSTSYLVPLGAGGVVTLRGSPFLRCNLTSKLFARCFGLRWVFP